MNEVQTALMLRMEATLTKFEKQLAKARKVGTDTAVGLERQFKRSNDKMAASAEASAQAMVREMDRLRAKYDPVFAASKRYENALEELNRAHKLGALNVAQHERALEALNAEYSRTATVAGRASGAMAGMRGSTALSGSMIQNFAYQVGDFAVQVGSGARASQALGQQLPQLLGGFGVMGAVMGAVVAVAIPLTSALVSMAGAGEDLEDLLENLEEAVADYSAAVQSAIIPTDELREKYGTATAAARDFLSALVEINQIKALDEVKTSLAAIAEQFGGLSDDLINVGGVKPLREIEITAGNIAEKFGITTDEALSLTEAMRMLSDANGIEAQVRAGNNLLDVMIATLGPIESMSGAARQLAEELSTAGIAAAEVKANVDRTTFSIRSVAAGISNAGANLAAMVGDAGALGDNMYRAANAAWSFLQARAREKMAYESTVGRGRGQDPRLFGGSFGDVGTADPRVQDDRNSTAISDAKRKAAEKAARAGRRGGRRGREKDSLYEIGQQELQNLERQIELIGKSDAEVAELTARYKLLDEAKKRGIDLDSRQAGSSKTVREQIDAQAEAIGRLTEKAEQYKEQAAFMDGLNKELKDGFIDAIIEGENFGDVLANVAKQLAKAALQAALFNEGPFSSGGGGILGFFKNLLTGKRASGGGVSRGAAYLVNENTPKSEVFVPSQAGAILTVSQAQAALRSQTAARGAGGVARVVVEGGNLVLTDSGQIAARIRVSEVQARRGAVQDVKGNWGAFQSQFATDGDIL